MGEYRLEDEDRASLVLELMKGGRAFGQCITLAQNCRTMEEVERYMNQECPICADTFMMDEVSGLSDGYPPKHKWECRVNPQSVKV